MKKPEKKQEKKPEKKQEKKKYVNPILAWAIIGCEFVLALVIGLSVLINAA